MRDHNEPKLSICLFNRFFHTKIGGIETYTHRMAQAFAQRGHEVHIVTTQGEDGQEKFFLNRLGENITVHKVPHRTPEFLGVWTINKFFPFFYWNYHRSMRRFMKNFMKLNKVDIVEVPDFEGYKPIFSRNFPVLVRLHGYNGMLEKYGLPNRKKTWANRILWRWSKMFFETSDMCLSVSRYFADLISNVFQLDHDKINVCYLGVNRQLFYPPQSDTRDPEVECAQNDLIHLKCRTQTVLFVGRHDKDKGVEVLANAIPLVCKEYANVNFKFIGRDMKHKELNKSYKKLLRLQLTNYPVEFLDSVPAAQLAEHLRRSDLCVFPSYVEAGATGVIEAISCGCPVIVSDIGTFKEYFRHAENALVVPVGNHVALAAAIVKLLNDKDLASRLSQGALREVHLFDLDNIVEESLNLYRKAIHRFKTKKRPWKKFL